METRIRIIRKNARLTQSEFGERIGLNGNTITGYEKSYRTPSNAVITAICREFDINEEWLRNGTGPMKKETPVSYIDELAREHNLVPAAKQLLNMVVVAFEELGDDQASAIMDRMFEMLSQREIDKSNAAAAAAIQDAEESDDSGVDVG